MEAWSLLVEKYQVRGIKGYAHVEKQSLVSDVDDGVFGADVLLRR